MLTLGARSRTETTTLCPVHWLYLPQAESSSKQRSSSVSTSSRSTSIKLATNPMLQTRTSLTSPITERRSPNLETQTPMTIATIRRTASWTQTGRGSAVSDPPRRALTHMKSPKNSNWTRTTKRRTTIQSRFGTGILGSASWAPFSSRARTAWSTCVGSAKAGTGKPTLTIQPASSDISASVMVGLLWLCEN
jgi:hypothetical protein